MTAAAAPAKLLDVRGLRTHFFTEEGVGRAVDGVSLWLERGRVLGLVGESGSGKSMTALSILRLVPRPGRIVGGEILFEGKNLLDLPETEMRSIRGNRISMIFQEPMTSLNPVHRVGSQIAEAVRLHQGASKKAARDRAVELLGRVRIPAPEKRVDAYPHQLSGGMRQRAMIAMALACDPALLIADEPTTALDVTIQAQIMELLLDLKREVGMAILLITHNLGLVAEAADHIAVMYASKVVEHASAEDLFSNPLHPYTVGLLRAVPRLGMKKTEKLSVIPGSVPNPLRFPSGCKFHPRCPARETLCESEEPALAEARPGHWASCRLIKDGAGPVRSWK